MKCLRSHLREQVHPRAPKGCELGHLAPEEAQIDGRRYREDKTLQLITIY